MTPFRIVAAGLLALGVAACGGPRRGATRSAPLSRDSAAVLERAIRLARPGFDTQDEALRAGAYGTAPAPAAAAPAPAPGPAPGPVPTGAAAGAAEFVIQIAAFRDLPSAERAASATRRGYPELEVVVERAGEYFRVALAGWSTPEAAATDLSRVRQRYPGAWLRRRSLP